MKKLLSLALALSMLLLTLCPALAETVAATQTLTSPDGSYSYEVPADYVPINAETFMTMFNTPEMQQLMAQMMGLQDASQLEMYFTLMQESNMMIVYANDLTGNLNVQAVPSAMTIEQIVLFKEQLDAAMAQQYMSLGIAEEDIHVMDIQEIAGRKWHGMQLKMMGQDMLSMTTVENGVQYVVTFTGIDAETCEQILASFTVAKAAE